MTVLGRLIKDSLAKLRLSMAEASRRSGCSEGYLKALVAGRIENPGILTLKAVAEAVGQELSALISAIEADGTEGDNTVTKEEKALLAMYRRASAAEKRRIFRADIPPEERPKGGKTSRS